MKAAKVLSKTVLVTGCSSGIGKEVAIYLRRTGWDVYPTARSEADLKELSLRDRRVHPRLFSDRLKRTKQLGKGA
jgi:NADP-dependent 3-hydroxy acid dehydrogenase YdfG